MFQIIVVHDVFCSCILFIPQSVTLLTGFNFQETILGPADPNVFRFNHQKYFNQWKAGKLVTVKKNWLDWLPQKLQCRALLKVCWCMFLFWHHRLTCPRCCTVAPTVSDPIWSEISCFQVAKAQWKNSHIWYPFFPMSNHNRCQ